MLKNAVLAVILLFTVTAVSAQVPVLTATSNPVASDWVIVYYTDTFNPGIAGAALTWHFDTLGQDGSDTNFFSDCAASPYCADFPGTSVYMHDNSSVSSYFNTSPTAMSFAGEYNISPIPYDNYEDELRYPFSYDSAYTDTFSSTFSNAGYTYHRWGTISVKADAYGTLLLPNGTYSNALRVRSVENFNDTTMSSGFVWQYNSVAYTWYTPGAHIELLNQYKSYRNGSLASISSYYTKPDPLSVTGASKASAAIQLYPNPANGYITLHCDALFKTGSSVDIFNVYGQHVGNYPLQGSTILIPVSQLPNGVYACSFHIPGQDTRVMQFVIGR